MCQAQAVTQALQAGPPHLVRRRCRGDGSWRAPRWAESGQNDAAAISHTPPWPGEMRAEMLRLAMGAAGRGKARQGTQAGTLQQHAQRALAARTSNVEAPLPQE